MFGLIDMLIVRPIANVLFVIYGLVGDFGLAIILFTILVKICMWPLVKRQLQQTRLMRKIQPELAEIKKNCNGNRQLESLQMMDLYKRNNIKPFRSIITLIIQLPIFIALYTAVRVIAIPVPDNSLELRAYAPVRQLERVEEVIQLQQPYLAYQEDIISIRNDSNLSNEEKESKISELTQVSYDFHPKLFGVVDLEPRAGLGSPSAFVILLFAFASAATQLWISRQQLPSKKSAKSRTFRQIMREASDGKEPDQAELNQIMSQQMSYTMPIMMLLIMINLPGALVFYYLISNLMTGIQQRYILNRNEEAMEISADKRILRELKHIEEGEIVSDKTSRWAKSNNSAKADANDTKPGVKITRISAKSNHRSHKKKRS